MRRQHLRACAWVAAATLAVAGVVAASAGASPNEHAGQPPSPNEHAIAAGKAPAWAASSRFKSTSGDKGSGSGAADGSHGSSGDHGPGSGAASGSHGSSGNQGQGSGAAKGSGASSSSAVSSAGPTGGGPSPNDRAKLAGSVPPWASSSRFKGAASGSDPVGFRVYLGWRDEAGAVALAKTVSDPNSPSYGHYLSPGQFRQQFAPSQKDVNAVQSWLRSQGFTVDYVPANNHYVAAEGTVAQAEAAFDVTLNEYSYQGLTLRAPSGELTIPSSLQGVVDAVLGLDQSDALVRPDHVIADAPPSLGFRNAPPCSSSWAETTASGLPALADGTSTSGLPYAPCGYTPPQLRGAYGVADGGLDGSGQTVAIVDAYASPTIFADASEYANRNDPDHSLRQGQFRQLVAPGTFRHPQRGNLQDPQGWYGEETLDVEAVHAMAPGANILFVGAPNAFQDLDAALNHVVDRRLARIVTNSYGFIGEAVPPGYVKPLNDTFIQAAAEGIGIYFSSGDFGDDTAFGIPATPDWSASSPWVTAVGGTSLAVDSSNDYAGETGWSTAKLTLAYDSSGTPDAWGSPSFVYGGGGGVSALFPEPDYQVNAGIDASSFGFGRSGRVVPDVSIVGDPNTGMLVGQSQTFPDGSCGGGASSCYGEYRIGGTSLSSPLMAGLMALVDQQRADNGDPNLGFANPALYAAGSGAFHDVGGTAPVPSGGSWVVRNDFLNGLNDTSTDADVAPAGIVTSLRTLGWDGQQIHTGAGYDDMTGLGTPNGSAFLDALAP